MSSSNSGCNCCVVMTVTPEISSSIRCATSIPTPSSERSGFPYPMTRIILSPCDGPKDVSLFVPQFNNQRHGAYGVCRAGKTGVITADGRLDPVQGPFLDVGAVHVLLGHLQDGAVHRRIILTC